MDKLEPKEIAILDTLCANKELEPFFFRKAKGVKWFDSLVERKYFIPNELPAPKPAEQEGYYSVPTWHAIEYLVSTCPEFKEPENNVYAKQTLDFIRSTTQFAIDTEISNYQTWWRFSKIIKFIPVEIIDDGDMACVQFWLSDDLDRGLVAKELGEKWLLILLEENSHKSRDIAIKLLRIIYEVSIVERESFGSQKKEAVLRFEKWHAKKITKAISTSVGQSLGSQAVDVYRNGLTVLVDELDRDYWSSIWRSAIEEHEQNHGADEVEDILLIGLRDSLDAWVAKDPESALAYVAELLNSKYKILKRVGIYIVGVRYNSLSSLIDHVVLESHFTNEFQHEMWHFLKDNYYKFHESIKHKVKDHINQLVRSDEDGIVNTKATAYKKLIWLSAIREYESSLENQYSVNVAETGVEPEHPDFSSFRSVGGVIRRESPKSVEELLAMDLNDIVIFLNEYEGNGDFEEPSIGGLIGSLKLAIKAAPLKFIPTKNVYSKLESLYIHTIIDTYTHLWKDGIEIPWNDAWKQLLEFCEGLVCSDSFWVSDNGQSDTQFVYDRQMVVSSIAQLIESGVKTDKHAFEKTHLPMAINIINVMLKNENRSKFKVGEDALAIAINSARGHCLESLVNIALRTCRLADSAFEDHSVAWRELQPLFDLELSNSKEDETSFVAILVSYLPNFIYMSREWVLENLTHIFDRKSYLKWLSAMQGYAYVNDVYEDIYVYLQSKDHFIDALDDNNVNSQVSDKIVQNIAVAFLREYENIEDKESLIYKLINRNNIDEMSQLIAFISRFNKNKSKNHYARVLEIWKIINSNIDVSKNEGRSLASLLNKWFSYINIVDENNRELIMSNIEFAEIEYNSTSAIKLIARISHAQPYEAISIWKVLLKRAAPDYPDESVKEALVNILRADNNGTRNAESIVDCYLKKGNDRPSVWLNEMSG